MFAYWKMKKNEWKVKAMFYGAIISLIDNQKEILELLQKMYIALKDIPMNEFQEELVSKLVEIIHEENKDKNN